MLDKLNIREQVWIKAWCECVRSDSCIKLSTPTLYADECLLQFDKRFPQTEGQQTNNGTAVY